MEQMTVERAFEILGLSSDADDGALRKAYHKLSFVNHPDMPSGDPRRQAELNEAYEIASAAVTGRNALVSARLGRSIQNFEKAIESQHAGQRANEEAQRLVRGSVRQLQSWKNAILMGGLASAALAAFGKDLVPWLLSNKDPAQQAALQPVLIAIVGVCGLMAAFLQLSVKRIEDRVEAFVQEVSDPRKCAAELARVLDYEDVNVVDEDRIISASIKVPLVFALREVTLQRSLPSAARDEWFRVLVLKAIEHGLLVPIKPERVTPAMVVQYNVAFEPSRFRLPPPPPPIPRLPKDARSDAILFAGMFLVFVSATLALALLKHTLWSILPGFFSFGGLMGFIASVAEMREARNRLVDDTNSREADTPPDPK